MKRLTVLFMVVLVAALMSLTSTLALANGNLLSSSKPNQPDVLGQASVAWAGSSTAAEKEIIHYGLTADGKELTAYNSHGQNLAYNPTDNILAFFQFSPTNGSYIGMVKPDSGHYKINVKKAEEGFDCFAPVFVTINDINSISWPLYDGYHKMTWPEAFQRDGKYRDFYRGEDVSDSSLLYVVLKDLPSTIDGRTKAGFGWLEINP